MLVRAKTGQSSEDRLQDPDAQAGLQDLAQRDRRRRGRRAGRRPREHRRGRADEHPRAARRHRHRDPQRVDRLVRSADRPGVRHQRRRRPRCLRSAARERLRPARRARLDLLRGRHPQGRAAGGAGSTTRSTGAPSTTAATAAREQVEITSREPATLAGFMADARAKHGKEGPADRGTGHRGRPGRLGHQAARRCRPQPRARASAGPMSTR